MPRLQPLRIPTGWLVAYNDGFFEVDPASPEAAADPSLFKEDLLQLKHLRRDRLVDLGWYPDGDLAAGEYRIVVHQGDFHGPELYRFSARDRAIIVAELESLLDGITRGAL